MESEAQLWMTVGYIARNPVAAGLCAYAGDWAWSSHAATVANAARHAAVATCAPAPPSWLDVERLFSHLEAAGGEPRRRYLELVATPAPAAERSGSRSRTDHAARSQSHAGPAPA
jgi:hypothetical protein